MLSKIVLDIEPVSLYTIIDRPGIDLLAAMPLAITNTSTGTADSIARFFLEEVTQ